MVAVVTVSLCYLSVEGYLSRVLRNYTEQACDGDFLTVHCPPRTSITVQSAFYGRRDSAHSPQCPSTYSSAGADSVNDVTSCHVSTSLQVYITWMLILHFSLWRQLGMSRGCQTFMFLSQIFSVMRACVYDVQRLTAHTRVIYDRTLSNRTL